MRSICTFAFVCLAAFTSPLTASPQTLPKDSVPATAIDPSEYSAMRWRHVDLAPDSLHGNLGSSNPSARIAELVDSKGYAGAPDPIRKGLLFSGTPHGVFVSFDGGNHRQSLQLNMPPLDVHFVFFQQNALFATVKGQGVWILDDLEPLRKVGYDSEGAPSYLFKPAPFRRAAEANSTAPAAAVFYYELKSAPPHDITLEIHDSQGKSVRRFTSFPGKSSSVPDAATLLSKNVGLNRFVWDLHFAPGGPLVEPGQYEAILIANDSLMKQPVTISLDSRTPETQAAELKRIESGIAESGTAIHQMNQLISAIADRLHTLHTEKSPGDEVAAQRLAHGEESETALRDLNFKVAKILDGSAATTGLLEIYRKLSQAEIAAKAGMDPDPLDSSCTALGESRAAWRDLDAHVPETSTLIAKSSLAALPTATVMSIMAMPSESSITGCAPE
jgi:hypothetical protein